MKIKKLFHRKPKQRYIYKRLCRKCDIIFKKTNEYDNTCPICGEPTEVYSVDLIEGNYND